MLSRIFSLPIELHHNRRLILQLAKNDFKTKFSGSYLGIIWAFIQPIVTVLVYWFVFSKLRPGEGRAVPFVLWLVAGLVPWFFFSEALNNGTSALLEYSYLVKKVVFKISILPIVKVTSALFVHVFFILVVLVMYIFSGHIPGIHAIQIIYYSFCMFVMVLGISYATSAIVVFFRDLSQVINIVLQVGVWMTPIMWEFGDLNITGILAIIFKLNPMYYIVFGYREALIDKVWFWQHPWQTIYFWVFTGVVFFIGAKLFKRLKVHFADVL